jgi:hypothetical protein
MGDKASVFASQLDYALAYAALGMRIFPVSARKIPLIKWKEGATTDPEIIREWWGANGKKHAEIGWAIGPDIVALDGDTSHGQHGVADLERLLGVALDMLATPIATTPPGGRHFFFASGGKTYTNARIKGAAVDVKGCGAGYVRSGSVS